MTYESYSHSNLILTVIKRHNHFRISIMKKRRIILLIFSAIIAVGFFSLITSHEVKAYEPASPCGSVCYMVDDSSCTYQENGDIVICGVRWYL